MTDHFEQLANAIVLQAVKDYREAMKKLKKCPRNEGVKVTVAEVERFLHSDWYKVLTSVDEDFLMEKLRMEIESK